MRTISITKSNDTTIVKASDSLGVKEIIVSNTQLNYRSEGNKVVFENHDNLSRMGIEAKLLAPATLAALGLTVASTVEELMDAFVSNQFFVGK